MFATILLLLLATGGFCFIISWMRKRDKSLSHITTKPGYPLIRNALELISTRTILSNLMKIMRDYGGFVRLDVFYGIGGILVTDTKLLEFILGSSLILDKGFPYSFLHRWLGRSLLTTTGKRWWKVRKLLTPAFHFQILEQYVDFFDPAIDIFVEKLRQNVDKGPFDVYPHVKLCTLDIICEAAMGTKINAQENSSSEYVRGVAELSRITVERTIRIWKMFNFSYVFTSDYRTEKRYVKVLHGHTNSVIKIRKEELGKSGRENGEAFSKKKKKLAFLDLLLRSTIDGRLLTDEEIRREVDTFMFAGHDTTAVGISFTLYCLSVNPLVQAKVMNELEEIFGGDKNRPSTYKDLHDMRYLELVIKESMRLYPPVPVFIREANEDVDCDGCLIPIGTQLAIFTYGLHRDPTIYPEPEKFDPNRFTLENQAGRNPFSYLAFSAGQRNCIGQKFAMLEMKSTLAKVLRNFEILPVADYEPELIPITTLFSLNGVLIGLKQRD